MDTDVLSSGIQHSNLPKSYVRRESESLRLSEVLECENVPGCDDQSLIDQQINYACKRYCVFHVINHGVCLETMKKMLEVPREFFILPVEEKPQPYSDDPSKTIRLSTSFNVTTEKVHDWRDYHRPHSYPLQKYVPEWTSNPTSFKRFPLDVGENAFGKNPHDRERSQNDSVGMLAIHQADPDSANPNQQASPALNNTSSASDQNTTASAQPENNGYGNEQPPPDRSLSDMENGGACSQTERRNERTLLNLSKAAKACLLISGEVGLASTAIRFTSTKSLSHNTSILLSLAELFSVAGFSLCLCGYTLQNTNRNNRRGEAASGLLTRAGSVVTTCSFLSFMGTQFPDDIMIWLTCAICMIPISVLPFMI